MICFQGSSTRDKRARMGSCRHTWITTLLSGASLFMPKGRYRCETKTAERCMACLSIDLVSISGGGLYSRAICSKTLPTCSSCLHSSSTSSFRSEPLGTNLQISSLSSPLALQRYTSSTSRPYLRHISCLYLRDVGFLKRSRFLPPLLDFQFFGHDSRRMTPDRKSPKSSLSAYCRL